MLQRSNASDGDWHTPTPTPTKTQQRAGGATLDDHRHNANIVPDRPSMQRRVWKLPSFPVMPCTTTRGSLLTSTLIRARSSRTSRLRRGVVAKVGGSCEPYTFAPPYSVERETESLRADATPASARRGAVACFVPPREERALPLVPAIAADEDAGAGGEQRHTDGQHDDPVR